MILRFPLILVEPAVSVDCLELAIRLPSVVPEQLQHRVNTLAALRATTTGRIHLAGSLTANGRRRLLQLAIGQCIAQADIHGVDISS